MTWKDALRKILDEDPEDMTAFMNVSPRMKREAKKRKTSKEAQKIKKTTPTVYGQSSKEGAKLYQDLVLDWSPDYKVIKRLLDNYLESLILSEVLSLKKVENMLYQLEDIEEKITDFMKESGGDMAVQLEVMGGRFKFNHSQRTD